MGGRESGTGGGDASKEPEDGFAINRIKKLSRSQAPEAKVTVEGCFLLGRATERFIQELVARSSQRMLAEHRRVLGYSDIEHVVHSGNQLAFLYDIVPPRIPISQLIDMCRGMPADIGFQLASVEEKGLTCAGSSHGP